MKSSMLVLAAIGMMGGIGVGGVSLAPNRDSNRNIPKAPPATDEQRRMFTQPVKLSKKQKAKRKANS